MISTLVLVSCVKLKRDRPMPARDLYCSPLFGLSKAYADRTGAPWMILSAKYGLVLQEQRIAPYELTLNSFGAVERRDWALRVSQQLARHLAPHATITFLAGRNYLSPLEDLLKADGHHVVNPMAGLSMGRRLQWLSAQINDR